MLATIPIRRRHFLRLLGASAAGLALSGCGSLSDTTATSATADIARAKALRGLFPIGQTPFTDADKLDTDGLASEVSFCNRGGVHGFIWPQIASNWTTLSEQERLDGAEAILSAGKGGRTALVIGVQSTDGNLATVDRYAKHALKNGADAIVSLPPPNVTEEKALLEYYQQVGKMTDLPLFVQTQGNMSVDLVIDIYKTIPTARYVKDEADPGGGPLVRIAEIRKRTDDQMKVFSGQGVRTMVTEMELGFSGHCPYTGLADVYAQAFDLWHAGKRREAFDMFGRILAFSSVASATGNPILIARGVFKPSTKSRGTTGGGGAGRGARGGGAAPPPRDPESELQIIRKALDDYLKPYLRA